MNIVPSTIYYDQDNKRYNFPFVIVYQDKTDSVDFLFTENDYDNQEEMLRDRIYTCSYRLFEKFTGVFETLQELCLDDELKASDHTANQFDELLQHLYHFFRLFHSIHCPPDLMNGLHERYDELIEMFLLLDDYYPGERKKELSVWKHMFIDLDH